MVWMATAAQAGIGLLKGLNSYKQQQQQYKTDKKIAAYNNALNEQEYILNTNIDNFNKVQTDEDFITNLLANDKQELVDKGSVAVSQEFSQRAGNSAALVEDAVEASYNAQESAIASAYEQKMHDLTFNKAKNYLNYMGGKTWMPNKPSMFSSIFGGLLGSGEAVYKAYKDEK